MTRGQLTVIRGCMFAGKTARLIALLRQAQGLGRRAIAFKHALDVRYDHWNLATHDGQVFPAEMLSDAEDILNRAAFAEFVGIDEAQFFGPALLDVCRGLQRRSVDVVVVGIDFDTWGKPFAPFPELLSEAQFSETLTVPCRKCGADAHLNQRLTRVIDGNLVGGPGDYEPRCEKCFVPLAETGLVG